MKIKPRIYAIALADIVMDKKNASNEKRIIHSFLRLLEKNRDMKKAKEIISLVEAIFFEKTGNKKVILEMARKIDTKNILKDFIKKGDVIEEKINPKLIAGIKIIINNEKQLDFSLQKKIQEIFL